MSRLDKQIRDHYDQKVYRFNEAHWQDMESLLDKQERRRKFAWWWAPVLLLMLAGGTIAAFYLWSGVRHTETVPTTPGKEMPAPAVVPDTPVPAGPSTTVSADQPEAGGHADGMLSSATASTNNTGHTGKSFTTPSSPVGKTGLRNTAGDTGMKSGRATDGRSALSAGMSNNSNNNNNVQVAPDAGLVTSTSGADRSLSGRSGSDDKTIYRAPDDDSDLFNDEEDDAWMQAYERNAATENHSGPAGDEVGDGKEEEGDMGAGSRKSREIPIRRATRQPWYFQMNAGYSMQMPDGGGALYHGGYAGLGFGFKLTDHTSADFSFVGAYSQVAPALLQHRSEILYGFGRDSVAHTWEATHAYWLAVPVGLNFHFRQHRFGLSTGLHMLFSAQSTYTRTYFTDLRPGEQGAGVYRSQVLERDRQGTNATVFNTASWWVGASYGYTIYDGWIAQVHARRSVWQSSPLDSRSKAHFDDGWRWEIGVVKIFGQ